jgi:hypothetical protein
VVLAPDVRGQQVVQRGDRAPPRQRPADFQPFGVLVEHRVDDVDERLVAGEQAVPAGQQVALQPALAGVLGEHLDHAPVGAQIQVDRKLILLPGLPGHLEHGAEAIGLGLVGAEDPEVLRRRVQRHHIAQHVAEHARGLGRRHAGIGDGHRVVAEVGEPEIPQQQPAVGVRAGAQAPVAAGDHGEQVLARAAIGVEELFGPVGAHPLIQLLQMLRVGRDLGQRDLMRAPGALDRQAVHERGPGPPLGGAQHDHRPVPARRRP